MKKSILFIITVWILSFTISSCSENSSIVPDPEYGWGTVMAGNDPDETTWPDYSENYWEFTVNFGKYDAGTVGLKITGQFPNTDTRFFNLTLYSDSTTERFSSIEDFNIVPDEGSQNPFMQEGVSGSNYFTLHVLPDTANAANYANPVVFPVGTERVTMLLRIYFNSTEHAWDFGGVDLPKVVLVDLATGQELGEAPRGQSLYYIRFGSVISRVPQLTSQKKMVFTLAPNVLYGNGPTGYLTSTNRMHRDSLLLFRFIPPHYPASVGENITADVRYWSLCTGDTLTYTRHTLADKVVQKTDDGFVNFMIVDPSVNNYAEIKTKAQQMKINVMEWDIDSFGEPLFIFYRQMYINTSYEYSIMNIESYPPLNDMGQPDQSLADIGPQNIANYVLGDYGPCGQKLPGTYFLSDEFSYADMRF